ncbi:HNH endonuclease [Candidatus Saccharibacteria bacterium]|nr:HNH endonuclease [Candidatus Saccharibacteria bacterium]
MAFTEKLKLRVKKKAAFRCVICRGEFVEVHHIIRPGDGGSDDEDNAAPLCASCHDNYGDNPSKRKQIREMRDYLYEIVAGLEQKGIMTLPKPLTREEIKRKMRIPNISAIYHVVYSHEDFNTSARILFELVKEAQLQSPGRKRVLYLDIDGHRNKKGGFDADMFELQNEFMFGFLMKYLSEVYIPFGNFKNSNSQDDNIPDGLEILPAPG